MRTSLSIYLLFLFILSCGGSTIHINRAKHFDLEGGRYYGLSSIGYCQAALFFSEAAVSFVNGEDLKSAEIERRKAEDAEARCVKEIEKFWSSYTGCDSINSPLDPVNYFVWGSEWLRIANYYKLEYLAKAIITGRNRWQKLCADQYAYALQNEYAILAQARLSSSTPMIQLPSTVQPIPVTKLPPPQPTILYSTKKESGVELRLKLAIESILEGGYNQAVSILKELDSVYATILKGFCYEMLGDKDRSKAIYSNVVEDRLFGDFIKIYIKNLDKDPANADSESVAIAKSFFNEGKKLAEEGEYDKAIENFVKSYKYVPHPVILYNIGVVYDTKEMPKVALVYYILSMKDPKAKENAQKAINKILGK